MSATQHLTPSDPYCATCGRPADAHTETGRCPERAAGMFATYRRP